MCIRTRLTHWRATGVLVIAAANLLAIALIVTSMPAQIHSGALTGAIALIVASTLSAMYFSPQARQVRREIVARSRGTTEQH